MTRIAQWLQNFALAIGGPGLFIIGFLDSSFLSFPEINDFLVIWMVTPTEQFSIRYSTLPDRLPGALRCASYQRWEALLQQFTGHTHRPGDAVDTTIWRLALVMRACYCPRAVQIFVLMAGGGVPLRSSSIAIGRGVVFRRGILAVL